jgi:hypothetical protein
MLHFERPIAPGHACQHYIGHAEDLARRIMTHMRGVYNGGGNGCAKLCAVAKQRNIKFQVARVWRGDYDLEQRIKKRRDGRDLCPICSPHPFPVAYAVELGPDEIKDALIPF